MLTAGNVKVVLWNFLASLEVHCVQMQCLLWNFDSTSVGPKSLKRPPSRVCVKNIIVRNLWRYLCSITPTCGHSRHCGGMLTETALLQLFQSWTGQDDRASCVVCRSHTGSVRTKQLVNSLSPGQLCVGQPRSPRERKRKRKRVCKIDTFYERQIVVVSRSNHQHVSHSM